jgi:hypothetical protein
MVEWVAPARFTAAGTFAIHASSSLSVCWGGLVPITYGSAYEPRASVGLIAPSALGWSSCSTGPHGP